MLAEYDGRQIVGIDLHRRRTVIVRTTEAGRPTRLCADRQRSDRLGGGGREGRGASGRRAGSHLRLVLGRRCATGRRCRGLSPTSAWPRTGPACPSPRSAAAWPRRKTGDPTEATQHL